MNGWSNYFLMGSTSFPFLSSGLDQKKKYVLRFKKKKKKENKRKEKKEEKKKIKFFSASFWIMSSQEPVDWTPTQGHKDWSGSVPHTLLRFERLAEQSMGFEQGKSDVFTSESPQSLKK